MRTSFIILLLWLGLPLAAQDLIRGRLRNEKGEALANASVYIPQTSRGTVSAADGSFTLTGLPAGNFQLAVSSVGYETLVSTITQAQRAGFLDIRLREKQSALNEVVVRRPEKDGWAKWGKTFMDAFVGNSDYATQCRLLNKEKLQFVWQKENELLQVYSEEPLLLENHALGYALRIDLDYFELHTGTGVVDFRFYPLFSPLQGTEDEIVTWKANRETAYRYSLAYFLRLLAAGRFESKYHVRKLVIRENTEKARVNQLVRVKGGLRNLPKDSTAYYEQVLRQPDRETEQFPDPVDASQLVQRSGTSSLINFPDYLLVQFRRKPAPAAYTRFLEKQEETAMNNRKGTVQFTSRGTPYSEMRMEDNEPIEVSEDGFFLYNNLYVSGFWGWWEKLATRLPMEYRP